MQDVPPVSVAIARHSSPPRSASNTPAVRRRLSTRKAVAAACAGVFLALGLLGSARADDINITFIATSDPHYRVDDGRVEENRVTLLEINRITEESWPEHLGGGKIDRPLGVLALGDLIDDGDHPPTARWGSTQGQWERFDKHFGVDGTDGLLKYPVFATWGNHDGPPVGEERHGFSTQAQLKARAARLKDLGLVDHLSENGLHYAWDWGGVRFVMLGIYPADEQHPAIRYNPVWHNPQGALSFLAEDLNKKVGDSGRPVVVMSHCGIDADWWHAADKEAFYNVVKDYNTVAYFYGHSGTGSRRWSPSADLPPLNCINTGQTTSGFFVVQITSNRLRAAYRAKESRESPDTGWIWRFPVDWPIQAVAPEGLAAEPALAK